MDDEAHVRLVHAEAERDGRGHDQVGARAKFILARRAQLRRQAGVIGGRCETRAFQRRGQAIRRLAHAAINDAGAAAPRGDQPDQLAHWIVFAGQSRKGDRGAPERADEQARRTGEQIFDNVGPGARRGGRRGRDDLRRAERIGESSDPAIVGAEIMPPLRDAMRLVHGEGAHIRLAQEGERFRVAQTLRREIEQPQPAQFEAVMDPSPGFRRDVGVQGGGGQPERLELARLIAHQGDQRRHHQGQARTKKRRELIDHGFAGAGGGEDENVLAVERGLKRAGLARQKIGKAEAVAQKRQRFPEISHGAASPRQKAAPKLRPGQRKKRLSFAYPRPRLCKRRYSSAARLGSPLQLRFAVQLLQEGNDT